MGLENFRTYASHKSNAALEEKQNIDYARDGDIAERIGEILADRVEAGEKDPEKLMALAEELALIAASEIVSVENDGAENAHADNIVEYVLYKAEHSEFNGLSVDRKKANKFVVTQ